MNKNILPGLSLGIGLAGIIVWRLLAAQHTSVVHIVDVHDISRSHFQGCGVFEALARDAVQAPGLSSKSTLTILASGNKSTANEPVAIARYDDLKSTRAVEGTNAEAKRLQARLQDIEQKCNTLAPTDRSPIILAIQQGLAVLHSKGCTRQSQCVLNVDTDGQENADRSMHTELDTRNAHHSPALPSLDNDGTDVRFCGLASTAGRLLLESGEVRSVTRHASGDDQLRRVWTGLFTNPNRVHFAPFCPR